MVQMLLEAGANIEAKEKVSRILCVSVGPKLCWCFEMICCYVWNYLVLFSYLPFFLFFSFFFFFFCRII